MASKRIDLGELNDVAAIAKLVPVSGLRVADVGCGPGATSRELAAMGAEVLGVEPDPVQAAKNREAEPVAHVTFAEGGAQSLPLETGSTDLVVFFRSLHHVPLELMDAALAEAARVLKPGTGTLCVVEPGMEGSNFAMMRNFHDETAVRTAAQAALARNISRLFGEAAYYRYEQYPRHKSFAAMVERVMGQTFNSLDRARVESEETRAAFEKGRTATGDYVFDQPMLLDVYRKAARG
ncbi:MAG: class I SAM-dependent methyltransferase [Sphingomonadales bacterium]|nr:class I SAM-dependent methyltransferase [Sphingomonadales bacterium]MDE2567801.1 class I SAM-dependent methyltransferase [Sphingomonadales bacterium]